MANQAGAVATKSIVANIKAIQVAVPMMKNMINKGQPPSPPTELSKLDLIRVVGKREPVRIYKLLGKREKLMKPQNKFFPYSMKDMNFIKEENETGVPIVSRRP